VKWQINPLGGILRRFCHSVSNPPRTKASIKICPRMEESVADKQFKHDCSRLKVRQFAFTVVSILCTMPACTSHEYPQALMLSLAWMKCTLLTEGQPTVHARLNNDGTIPI
jgi:hypothetical protein